VREIEASKLIFIDESGVNLALLRLYMLDSDWETTKARRTTTDDQGKNELNN